MRATVLVTLLNDRRVVAAIDSALNQGPILGDVVVADGGSKAPLLKDLDRRYGKDPRVRILNVPGNVAASRNASLSHLKDEAVAFLDADEVAPPGWLDALTRPIQEDRAEFTGGPTRPLHPAKRFSAQAYIDATEARLYARHVPTDLALLPMGNSAWNTALLRRIGGFDERLAWGGEDYDVNLRAIRVGARGAFVPEAWVYHDQSHLDSYLKVVRRKYRYHVGAATAYIKNGALAERQYAAVRRFHVGHPMDLVDVVLKPAALIRARRYHRRAYDPDTATPRA